MVGETQGQLWARVTAVTIGSLLASLAIGVALARFLPISREARLAIGFFTAAPIWVTAMCVGFLARSGARVWCGFLAVTAALGAATLMAGCASAPDRSAATPARSATLSPIACDPSRDRTAILAMAGEYDVTFSFEETVALADGYTLRPPYRVGGSELVLVVEDSTRRVSLQHLLVVERDGKQHVIKHWRQDWTLEDPELFEYRGGKSWEKRALQASDVRCTWTQAVFEVSDGPRYESWGRWTHASGVSSWTSNETWRPLPRREHTKRTDYDVLLGINRHTITPDGWVHEQDNTKFVLGSEPRALVREHGINRYQRTTTRDFRIAREYWNRTEAFWREVSLNFHTTRRDNAARASSTGTL